MERQAAEAGWKPEQPWPLTTGELPAVQRLEAGVRMRSGAVFSMPLGFRPLRLDLYLPPETDGPFPLVVWIHGGAFLFGDRTALPFVLEQTRPFIRLPILGFAVASVEYRLSGEAVFPAQLEDVQAAIRWLRARHAELGIDPARIAVWGESAGGHLAALAGVTGSPAAGSQSVEFADQPTDVAAVVDWYGTTDFVAMDRQAPPDAALAHDDPEGPEALLIGAPLRARPDLVEQANPVARATSDAPPFLIMHGTRDRLVPFGQSELMADRLTELGVPVEFHAFDADHGFDGHEDTDGLVELVVGFLTRLLQPGS